MIVSFLPSGFGLKSPKYGDIGIRIDRQKQTYFGFTFLNMMALNLDITLKCMKPYICVIPKIYPILLNRLATLRRVYFLGYLHIVIATSICILENQMLLFTLIPNLWAFCTSTKIHSMHSSKMLLKYCDKLDP